MNLPHPHPEELFKAYLRIQSANNQIQFDKMGFFHIANPQGWQNYRGHTKKVNFCGQNR